MPYSDAWIDFMAGWCSGAAAVVVCQPVDTLLTRHQAGRSLIVGSLSSKELISQQGFFKLWRGSSAMIGAVPLQNALLMAGYGAGKRWSEDQNNDVTNSNTTITNSYFPIFVGGCTGGVIQSFLMSPVELVKVHQQVNVSRSALATTADVTRNLFRGMAWRGLGATILRDGLPHGVWFMSYEIAKDGLTKELKAVNNDSERHAQFTVPLFSGAFAATVAWAVGYPADLIKTRIQAGSGKGILATARELMNEPGGLYRGFGMKLVRSVPASMIGFVVYEFAKKQIESAQ